MVNLKNKVAYRKSQNYSDYIDITYVEICLVTSNVFLDITYAHFDFQVTRKRLNL